MRAFPRFVMTAAPIGLALLATACGSGQPDPTPLAQVTLSGAQSASATYGAVCNFFGEKGFQITFGPREESREKVDPTLFLSFSDFTGTSGYDTLLVANVPGKEHGGTQGRGGAHVEVTVTKLGEPTRSVLAGSFTGSYLSPAGVTHVAGTFSGCVYPGVTP